LESIHTKKFGIHTHNKTIYKQKQEGAYVDSFCSILYPMTTPDVPPEFQEVHKDATNIILGVFEMPKQANTAVFSLEIGSMPTHFQHKAGSLRCKDGKKYDINILWKGTFMRGIDPVGRIIVPYRSDYHFHISVRPEKVEGQSGQVFSYHPILKEIADGLMPIMYGGPKEHISLRAEDNSFSMNWKVHGTAIVVQSSEGVFKITGYGNHHTGHIPERIEGHLQGIFPKCNRWVLCKGVHYYFLNYNEALRSIKTYFCDPQYVFPTRSMVEQAKAREAELFTAFLTGTHGRLGENSVLVKYLSSCVVPLYEVFMEGRIQQ
jgi:hypothetical protein